MSKPVFVCVLSREGWGYEYPFAVYLDKGGAELRIAAAEKWDKERRQHIQTACGAKGCNCWEFMPNPHDGEHPNEAGASYIIRETILEDA